MRQREEVISGEDGPLAIEETLSPSTSQEAMLKKSMAVPYDGTSDGCNDYRMLMYLEAQGM